MDAIRSTRGSNIYINLVRAFLFTLFGLQLYGCGHHSDEQPPAGNGTTLAALRLNAIQSCDEYKTYVTNSLVEQYRPRGWGTLSPVVVDGTSGEQGAPVPATSSNAGAGDASSAPTHVTGTNTQEEGVDEPDIVKTDSNGVMYIARGNGLRIVAGHPPKDLRELATIDAGGAVYDLFLDTDQKRAVLFAAHYDEIVPASPPLVGDVAGMPSFYLRVQYVVSFVDVSTPTDPQLLSRWTFDGYPLDSRRVGKRVHFVLSDPIQLPAILANDSAFWKLYGDYYSAKTEQEAAVVEQKIVDAVSAAVANLDVTDLLPSVSIDLQGNVSKGPVVGCGDIASPSVITRPNLLTVASFDTDGGNLKASAIIADGSTVYGSPENLYVTQPSGGWFGNAASTPSTAIHKFAVTDSDTKYVASGLVPGWVRNSYALSEYKGDLRVATNTTTWNKSGTLRTNDLFVLKDDGAGTLTERGSVRGFGANESIFATRFLGDRGFVVTFRQIDPLFAFDLSNPDAPALVGELTIPGFSTYLHPLDDTHLLTVGRDGTTRALQIQVFDVSDLATPTLIEKFTPQLPDMGYAYSAAEYDPHAFTYDELNKVLSIPLSYWSNTGPVYFNGIVALKIADTYAVNEITRVDHADLATASQCGVPLTLAASCNGIYAFQAYPRRSVIMTANDQVTLYTISDAGVKATDLAPPHDTLATVVFPPVTYDPYPVPVY